MATVLSGVVSDYTILSDQKVRDVSERISLLEADLAPLATFLMRLRKKATTNQKTEWLSDELIPRLSALAASAATGDTTVGVTSGQGQYFRVNDVLRISSTGENVAVTAVSTDTLGVTRAIGSVTGLSAASGVDVILVGNASQEGATIGTLKQAKLTAGYNYTQIQRNPYGATMTLAATELYGGPDLKRERNKKLLEHKIAIEHTLWWGRRNLITSGTQPQGFAGGLDDYISTNITSAASGALTQTAFETFLRTGFRYGSRNKVFFCSPLIASGLSSFALGRLAPPSPRINDWGVSVTSYQSGAGLGSIDIVVCKEFMDFQTASPNWGGAGFLIDMDDVRFRPLQNNGIDRDTKHLEDRQAPDEDSQKNEFLTEWTLEIGQEKFHSKLRGVTAYS